MKTFGTFGAVFAAVAVLGVTAGCATVGQSSAYRFEVVGEPVPTGTGTMLTVRLLNAATGQRVTDAEVFSIRTVWAISPKAIPAAQSQRTPLKPDGHGDYLYESSSIHAGEKLNLSASVPGSANRIVGTIETPRSSGPG